MDAFDLMSDFEEENINNTKEANEQNQTEKIEPRSLNENTSGKDMTVPSSDVKNENSNGEDFSKSNTNLGKRTFNQISQCILSPTLRDDHKNESNSDKAR